MMGLWGDSVGGFISHTHTTTHCSFVPRQFSTFLPYGGPCHHTTTIYTHPRSLTHFSVPPLSGTHTHHDLHTVTTHLPLGPHLTATLLPATIHTWDFTAYLPTVPIQFTFYHMFYHTLPTTMSVPQFYIHSYPLPVGQEPHHHLLPPTTTSLPGKVYYYLAMPTTTCTTYHHLLPASDSSPIHTHTTTHMGRFTFSTVLPTPTHCACSPPFPTTIACWGDTPTFPTTTHSPHTPCITYILEGLVWLVLSPSLPPHHHLTEALLSPTTYFIPFLPTYPHHHIFPRTSHSPACHPFPPFVFYHFTHLPHPSYTHTISIPSFPTTCLFPHTHAPDSDYTCHLSVLLLFWDTITTTTTHLLCTICACVFIYTHAFWGNYTHAVHPHLPVPLPAAPTFCTAGVSCMRLYPGRSFSAPYVPCTWVCCACIIDYSPFCLLPRCAVRSFTPACILPPPLYLRACRAAPRILHTATARTAFCSMPVPHALPDTGTLLPLRCCFYHTAAVLDCVSPYRWFVSLRFCCACLLHCVCWLHTCHYSTAFLRSYPGFCTHTGDWDNRLIRFGSRIPLHMLLSPPRNGPPAAAHALYTCLCVRCVPHTFSLHCYFLPIPPHLLPHHLHFVHTFPPVRLTFPGFVLIFSPMIHWFLLILPYHFLLLMPATTCTGVGSSGRWEDA